jgi:hypothetical protein
LEKYRGEGGALNVNVPESLIRILRSSADSSSPRFPPTEVYNEGWMLRLLLDAIQHLGLRSSPLAFEAGSSWYSEALLGSPFAARYRGDPLAEGFTNADGVVGHFDFLPTTKAGFRLRADATQFMVIEAKMFSNLSVGTKNAPTYNQAARSLACMATAIQKSGRSLDDFSSLGFFVVAPSQRRAGSDLETALELQAIKVAVRDRIQSYVVANRTEVNELASWEERYFIPFVDHLAAAQRLRLLSWEACIESVISSDTALGQELKQFYLRCLSLGWTVTRRGT